MAEPGASFPVTDVSDDAFLGGRLRLLQPRKGYRAGIDPVLLAAATHAAAGETVLELGTGVGTAILCLGARVSGLSLTGVEVQGEYAALARENAARNDVSLEVHTGDVTRLPNALRARQFDHVMMNPPYFADNTRTVAPDPGRETALSGADLGLWLETAIRRLGPGGRLTAIHDAAALPELLRPLDGRVGGVTILPLAAREGRPARRILLTARKGSRAAFRLLAPRVLHAGVAHVADGEDYTDEIANVLRNGAALDWERR